MSKYDYDWGEVRERGPRMAVMVAEQTMPLAQMVQTCNERWSYREMSERARRQGFNISHSQLADYASDSVRKVPSKEQIEALAAALDMGVEAVRAAVFEQFYGYVPRELGRGAKVSRIAAAVPGDITREEEEGLLVMIQTWLRVRRGGQP